MARPRPTPLPLFFGGGDSSARLLGWYHQPEGPARPAAVVICNPIGDDYIRAHRTLRHLAEDLAATGFAVLRFDFSGTGDSAGDERDPGRVAAWRDDLGAAIDHVRAASGVREVAVIGLRLGATFAADVAAARGDVASVVLWQPFVDGGKFTAETVRAHTMHRMLEPDSFASGPREYADGREVLGFFLTNETIAELERVSLMTLARKPADNVLVVGASNLPTEDRLLERLRSQDAKVAYRHLPGHKFLITNPHKSVVPQEVIDAIVGWLGETHPATAGTPASAAPPRSTASANTTASYRESPLWLGAQQPVFGMLVEPHAKPSAERPVMLLLNAGTVHRIGPHRLYVAMARELAALGFTVVRLDLPGIGDTPAAGPTENLSYPPEGQGAVQQAMSALSARLGTRRFIVGGLCSGADIAFKLGVDEPRVVGVVLLNPRTFCMNDLTEVEAYKGARYYQDSFFKREKWIKLLSGKVNVVRVAKMVAPKVKGVALRQLGRMLERVRPPREPAPGDVPAYLRRMAERGVDTLLMTSVHDPGVDFVDVNYAEQMRALGGLANFHREVMTGTDNTFTSVWSQAHVREAVRDHLASRYGA